MSGRHPLLARNLGQIAVGCLAIGAIGAILWTAEFSILKTALIEPPQPPAPPAVVEMEHVLRLSYSADMAMPDAASCHLQRLFVQKELEKAGPIHGLNRDWLPQTECISRPKGDPL